jgi:hypothetical protein
VIDKDRVAPASAFRAAAQSGSRNEKPARRRVFRFGQSVSQVLTHRGAGVFILVQEGEAL